MISTPSITKIKERVVHVCLLNVEMNQYRVKTIPNVAPVIAVRETDASNERGAAWDVVVEMVLSEPSVVVLVVGAVVVVVAALLE